MDVVKAKFKKQLLKYESDKQKVDEQQIKLDAMNQDCLPMLPCPMCQLSRSRNYYLLLPHCSLLVAALAPIPFQLILCTIVNQQQHMLTKHLSVFMWMC